jgi:hypothetical protein
MAAQRKWTFPSWLSSLLLVPPFFLLLYVPSLLGIELFDEALFQQLHRPRAGEPLAWSWEPTFIYYLFHATIFALSAILAVFVGRWGDSWGERR